MIIRPRNWKSFQHYSDRKPSWIKLHRDILDNYEYHCLPDASAALAPKLWLLASESEDGSIDANYEKLAFRLRRSASDIERALKPLIAANFFEVVQSASESLPEREHDACLEREVDIETEEEGDKTSVPQGGTVPRGTTPESVAKVFSHWRDVHGHPKAKLDAKRRKLIHRSLEAYSEADLCLAISGYKFSPHHMGQNERSTVYDDIELFLRDAKHIEAGIRFHANQGGNGLSQQSRRAISNTADWQPPETRRAAN